MSTHSVAWGIDVSDWSLAPVAVSAQNEQSYLLSYYGSIYYYNSPNNWSRLDCDFGEHCISVSVGYDGSVFTILSDSRACLLSQNKWELVSTSAVCGAVGDSYNYVIYESDGTLKIVNNGIPYNTVTVPSPLQQITTTVGNKHIWALDKHGVVYAWDGEQLNSVGSELMSRIHVSLSASNDLQVYAVDTDGFGRVFNFTNSSWETICHPGEADERLVSLEGGHSTIWATLSSGKIYQGYF